MDAIIELENKISFLLPDDFNAFYREMNGFSNWDWTPNMFSLWPIERILEEYNSCTNNEYVGFCDYLIHSHTLAFIKNRQGVFKNYGVEEPVFIARSFREAIHLICIDSDLIY